MKRFIFEKKEMVKEFFRGKTFSRGANMEEALEPLKLIEERQALKLAIKESEVKLGICEDKLKGLLGEEEALVVGDKVISWRRHNRKIVSLQELREEYPEVYNKHLKEHSYRKFEVKNI